MRILRLWLWRIASYLAVTVAAVSIPIPLLAVTVSLMRFYWLAFTVSHAEFVAWTVLVIWLALMLLLVWIGHRWRKDWLWRRYGIALDRKSVV